MGLNLEEIYGADIVQEQDTAQEEYSQFQPKEGYGWAHTLPEKQGLYDPQFEKDACGVGFAAYVFSMGIDCLVKDWKLTIPIVILRAESATRLLAMVSYFFFCMNLFNN